MDFGGGDTGSDDFNALNDRIELRTGEREYYIPDNSNLNQA